MGGRKTNSVVSAPRGTGVAFDLDADIARAQRELDARKAKKAAAESSPVVRDPTDFGDSFGTMFAEPPPQGVVWERPDQPAPLEQTAGEMAAAQEAEQRKAALAALQQRSAPGDADPRAAMATTMMGGQMLNRADELVAPGKGDFVTRRSANSMYQPTQDFTAEKLAGAETKRAAGEAIAAGNVQQYDAVTAEMERQQAAERDARIDLEAKNFAQAQDLEQQIDRVREANEAIADAERAIAEQPDADPNRWWESRSAGQKFAAVLGGMLAGFAGLDPMKNINAAIEQDIAAQHSAIGKRKTELAAAERVAEGENTLYRRIFERIGDERQADLLYSAARKKQAAAQMEMVARQSGRESFLAEQALWVNQLRQEAAADEYQAKVLRAKTPKYLTRTVDTRTPEEKELAMYKAKKLVDAGVGLGEAAGKHGLDLEKQELATTGKARVASATSRAEADAKWDERVRLETAAWGQVEDLIGDFLEKHPGDIGGVGASLPSAETNDFRIQLELLLTNAFTGATATERQADQIQTMIEGKWWDVGDDAFRRRLQRMQNISRSARDYLKTANAPTEAVIQTGDAGDTLGTFKAE